MSYDLYFTDPKLTLEQFQSHFAENPLYEVSATQAVYQNKDTGVYFVFDYVDQDSADTEDEGAILSTATFNLNYYRPHYFGLEAAPELARFVQRFNFTVFDPQNDGMGNGPFSTEGFLKGWNHGNRFGYSAVLKNEQTPKQVWSMSTERLEAIWRWNYLKAKHQEAFKEDIFVPRIFFVAIENAVHSVAVWPDAISELVPEVDYLFIGRKELAPKTLFGKKTEDNLVIPFEAVRQTLAPYRTNGYPLPAYKLPSPSTPENVRQFVRKLKPTTTSVAAIPTDQILNSEIIQGVR